MHIIATTRFNDKTWKENCKWREKNNWKGCIYGTPKQVSESQMLLAPMFILEMNNDENSVKGVGLVKNAIMIGQHHKIYSEGNYNRFTYKGDYRIDRENMTEEEEKIMTIFDVLLFKGGTHLKRGQGIIAVPAWIKNNKHINFVEFFKRMFTQHFQ